MNQAPARTRRPLVAAMLGGLTLIALIMLGVVMVDRTRILARSAESARPVGPPHAGNGRGGGYQPRITVETSGFFEVLTRLPRWAPDASLAEIADVWRNAPARAILDIDRGLKSTELGDPERIQLQFSKILLSIAEGEIDRAYEVLA